MVDVDSDNATANRMNIEAGHNAAPVVQGIVDELSESHAGEEKEKVEEAVQEKWTDAFGEAASPLDEQDSAKLAHHISEGDDITIVPPPADQRGS
jgi:molybdopterin converting factor small subunit